MKKQNKKGFTLAELLIVVAIIAVLTAIAVPLFVGALDNAEKRVGEANCRAVRGAAVEKILMNDTSFNGTDDGDLLKDKSGSQYKIWAVRAIVGASGDIKAMVIIPGANEAEYGNNSCKKGVSQSVRGVQCTANDYYIELIVKELSTK